MRKRLAVWLMKKGAMLYFRADSDTQNLKHAINQDTLIGGFAETGGHILGEIQPMCDYDTQSVVNVLRHGSLAINHDPASDRQECYREKWLY